MDLIVEQMEASEMPLPDGIENNVEKGKYFTRTTVRITSEEGARLLEREPGCYVTIETAETYEIGEPAFEEISAALANTFRELLRERRRVLILGIGNPGITPDSLGAKTVERLIISRPMDSRPAEFAEISGLNCPVYGVSGIESSELAAGLVQVIAPEAVIVVDALATSHPARLCKTIQIADTGLVPGGGVQNARQELSAQTLGVPVLSVGIPTVMNCAAFLRAINAEMPENNGVNLHQIEEELLITPRQMETAAEMGARIIGFALNKALHGDLSTEEIFRYLY